MGDKAGPRNNLTLAYLAGVIDCDGHITINRSVRRGVVYHGAVIGITGTRPEPHNLAAGLWGGKVWSHIPPNPDHRPVFQWARQGYSAIPGILAVLPYLRVKVDHALAAIKLQEAVRAKADQGVRDELRQTIIRLNQDRRRRGLTA